MFDFVAATKGEQIRVWSVEKAVEALAGTDPTAEAIVAFASPIENYIKNGKEAS